MSLPERDSINRPFRGRIIAAATAAICAVGVLYIVTTTGRATGDSSGIAPGGPEDSTLGGLVQLRARRLAAAALPSGSPRTSADGGDGDVSKGTSVDNSDGNINQTTSADSAEGNPPTGPFAELSGTLEDQRLLYEAEEMAIQACMRSRGHEYVPNQYSPNSRTEAWPTRVRPGDVEAASLVGYGVADSIELGESPLPLDKNEDRLERLSAGERQAWEEALRGRPISRKALEEIGSDPSLGSASVPEGPTMLWRRDSCAASARRAVYGDDVKHAELGLERDTLRNHVMKQMHEDPGYVAGVERWKACMSKRGLHYEHPGQAAEALMQSYERREIAIGDLRLLETDIAVADANCYLAVGLDAIQAEVQARAEEQMRANKPGQIGAVKDLLRDSLARARQLVTQ